MLCVSVASTVNPLWWNVTHIPLKQRSWLIPVDNKIKIKNVVRKTAQLKVNVTSITRWIKGIDQLHGHQRRSRTDRSKSHSSVLCQCKSIQTVAHFHCCMYEYSWRYNLASINAHILSLVTTKSAHIAAGPPPGPHLGPRHETRGLRRSVCLSCDPSRGKLQSLLFKRSTWGSVRLSVCDGDLIAGSKGWPFPVFIFLSLAVHGGGKAVPTLGRLDTQLARDFSTPLDAKVRGSKHNPPF